MAGAADAASTADGRVTGRAIVPGAESAGTPARPDAQRPPARPQTPVSPAKTAVPRTASTAEPRASDPLDGRR